MRGQLLQNVIFSKIVLPIVLFRYKSVIWDPLGFDWQFMLFPYASTMCRIEWSIHALIKKQINAKKQTKEKKWCSKKWKILLSHKAEQHNIFHTLFIWATLHLVCSDLNGHLYDIATKSVMMAPIFPLKNETPSSANDVSLLAPRGSLSFESHRSAPAHFAVMSAQWVCSSVAGLCFRASIYFQPFGPTDWNSHSRYHPCFTWRPIHFLDPT